MKKLIQNLKPPQKWKTLIFILSGIFIGLIVYIFYISKAHSYLSDDPKTCVNCHIMAPQYATWNHSAHREVTNCNECHVPHDNIVNHYYFKAKDGLRHATIFTLRTEPQVIKMHEPGQRVVQQNCVRCHTDLLTDARMLQKTDHFHEFRKDRQCWDCHRHVPHGRVSSLSSVPFARVPLPESPVPGWLKDALEEENND